MEKDFKELKFENQMFMKKDVEYNINGINFNYLL